MKYHATIHPTECVHFVKVAMINWTVVLNCSKVHRSKTQNMKYMLLYMNPRLYVILYFLMCLYTLTKKSVSLIVSFHLYCRYIISEVVVSATGFLRAYLRDCCISGLSLLPTFLSVIKTWASYHGRFSVSYVSVSCIAFYKWELSDKVMM